MQGLDDVLGKSKLSYPSAKQGMESIRDTFDAASECILERRDLRIHNFGTFRVALSKRTTGRNPQTGETIAITPQWTVRFRPSKRLKQKLNEK